MVKQVKTSRLIITGKNKIVNQPKVDENNYRFNFLNANVSPMMGTATA
ncbi:hypothetical protein [Texas Phoenix palm phytoplasma]|nr:hypothetical protein [Texas Phoenix palm phytoplasma]